MIPPSYQDDSDDEGELEEEEEEERRLRCVFVCPSHLLSQKHSRVLLR